MIILRTVEGSNVAKTSSGVPLNEGSSKVGGELVFARLATARFKLSIFDLKSLQMIDKKL